MKYPQMLYVISRQDGTFATYINEGEIPAPLDNVISMATYTLVKTEDVKRVVTLDKKLAIQP